MSSLESAAPLSIIPRASLGLALVLIFLHGLAAAVLISLKLSLMICCLLLGAITLSLIRTVRIHIMHKGRQAISIMTWLPDDTITIRDGQKDLHRARLSGFFITEGIIIINLRLSDGAKRALILPPDALDREVLRQARVRLRLSQHKIPINDII